MPERKWYSKIQRFRYGDPGVFATVLSLFLVMTPTGARSFAYVMPSEQLLYLTARNFSGLRTLIITQSARLVSPGTGGAEQTVTEKIRLRAPGLYHAEPIPPEDGGITEWNQFPGRKPGGDMFFRRLLMVDGPETAKSLLSEMGVDLRSVCFTRFEGIVAYHLGRKHAESPKLIIEKKTFLPLYLCYRGGNGAGMVSVRFKDYRKIKNGWYPFTIVYSGAQGVTEYLCVLKLVANTPIERELSEITMPEEPYHVPVKSTENPAMDKRLREWTPPGAHP